MSKVWFIIMGEGKGIEHFRVQEIRVTLFWPRYRKNAQSCPVFACTFFALNFHPFLFFHLMRTRHVRSFFYILVKNAVCAPFARQLFNCQCSNFNTVEPPLATTSRKRPPLLSDHFSEIPKFSQSKSLYLQSLVSDHLS